ncbi:MAG: 3-dehydroquinate synthase [Myxococcota bacterium]|jgi:3-dehydroquinate synthase
MVLTVELGERAYPIHVVDEGLSGLGVAVAAQLPPGRVAVVTNPVVGALYLEEAMESLAAAGFEPFSVMIPDGEANKTIATWHALVEDLLAARMTRSTPIIALGGGVTGDITGYAAASVLRGCPLVQVPTTLLSMVDSSVGGKTGVNSPRGKNLIGAFYQPRLVYAAMQTLTTLDIAEIRSGLGEVIKHGLLQDPELFTLCETRPDAILALDPDVMRTLVVGCCRVKADVVAADEREGGIRAILNLGHTVGHAIENALGYGEMRHGECVGIGMLAEARWAVEERGCDATVPIRLRACMERLQMPVRAPSIEPEQLIAAARADKKLSRGTLTTAILETIGRVRLERIPSGEILSMLARLEF